MADKKRSNTGSYPGNNNTKGGSPKNNSKNTNSKNNNSRNNNSGKRPGNNRPGGGKNNNNARGNKPAPKKAAPIPEEELILPVTEEEADDIRVTIDLDDGQSVECSIITILEVHGRDYIVLLPMDEHDQPNAAGEVLLYRYFEDENGIPDIDNILDDEEFEDVYDAFDMWQDDQLFDSMPD